MIKRPLLCLLLCSALLFTQEFSSSAYLQNTAKHRKNVAKGLFIWSGLNLAASGVMIFFAKRKSAHRSFHIGNLLWGAGNMVSGLLAYRKAKLISESGWDLHDLCARCPKCSL